jgi:hypothetical protein
MLRKPLMRKLQAAASQVKEIAEIAHSDTRLLVVRRRVSLARPAVFLAVLLRRLDLQSAGWRKAWLLVQLHQTGFAHELQMRANSPHLLLGVLQILVHFLRVGHPLRETSAGFGEACLRLLLQLQNFLLLVVETTRSAIAELAISDNPEIAIREKAGRSLTFVLARRFPCRARQG